MQLARTAIEQSPIRPGPKACCCFWNVGPQCKEDLRLDLHFHPYKLMRLHELSVAAYANRRNLCERIPSAAAFFGSDEAHFHISSAVSEQYFFLYSVLYKYQVIMKQTEYLWIESQIF